MLLKLLWIRILSSVYDISSQNYSLGILGRVALLRGMSDPIDAQMTGATLTNLEVPVALKMATTGHKNGQWALGYWTLSTTLEK